VGTIFHLTARVRCPFPVSIASLEEHLESVVIVPTSLEKATATSPTTPATKLRGPIVGDVANHYRQRWQEAAGQVLPVPVVPAPAGDVTVQLLRTVSERTYDGTVRLVSREGEVGQDRRS
jgi:hypothetical protein